ncbi:MAG: hypothetical protein NTV34_03140 [Proteobacteria bacterium]|nr:hypothetical protein [Pseudomonadota bacterium]
MNPRSSKSNIFQWLVLVGIVFSGCKTVRGTEENSSNGANSMVKETIGKTNEGGVARYWSPVYNKTVICRIDCPETVADGGKKTIQEIYELCSKRASLSSLPTETVRQFAGPKLVPKIQNPDAVNLATDADAVLLEGMFLRSQGLPEGDMTAYSLDPDCVASSGAKPNMNNQKEVINFLVHQLKEENWKAAKKGAQERVRWTSTSLDTFKNFKVNDANYGRERKLDEYLNYKPSSAVFGEITNPELLGRQWKYVFGLIHREGKSDFVLNSNAEIVSWTKAFGDEKPDYFAQNTTPKVVVEQENDAPPRQTYYGSYGGGSCFPFEAPILMADGTTKQIGLVRPDDEILSYDQTNGKVSKSTVKSVRSSVVLEKIEVGLANGGSIFISNNHPMFLATGEWAAIDPNLAAKEVRSPMSIQKLESGMKVMVANENHLGLTPVEVTSIHSTGEFIQMVNIDSAAPHKNFFAYGALVHNRD